MSYTVLNIKYKLVKLLNRLLSLTFLICTSLIITSVSTFSKEETELVNSDQEIEGENNWLKSFGVDLKGENFLLKEPYKKPLSVRSYIVPITWYKNYTLKSGTDFINRKAIINDLSHLKTIMEKTYGGWELAQNKGWNWDKWFIDWEKYLQANEGEKITISNALKPFNDLMEFQPDNHSGPIIKEHFNSGSISALLESEPKSQCSLLKTEDNNLYSINEKDQAKKAKKVKVINSSLDKLTNAYYISYPQKLGLVRQIKCGNEWINLKTTWRAEVNRDNYIERFQQIFSFTHDKTDSPKYIFIDEHTNYLRLPSFSVENTEKAQKLAEKLTDKNKENKNLILDLRFNGGGDAEGSFNLLSKFIDFKRLKKTDKFSKIQKKSCLTETLGWGYLQNQMSRIKPPVSDFTLNLLKNYAYNLINKPVSSTCPISFENYTSDWNYSLRDKEIKHAKKIVVLVDNFCGSDCEYLTYMMASLSDAVIVGTNTYGVGGFIQPGYFFLPNTKLMFRLARGASDLYGDNRSFDGYGLDVDVLLSEKEQNSPDYLIKLAKFLTH